MEIIGHCLGCREKIYSHRQVFISVIDHMAKHNTKTCWQRVLLYERDLTEEWRKLWKEAS